MTITPTASMPPGPPAAAASDGTTDPSVAGDFLAAMLQALGPTADGSGQPAGSGPGAGPVAGTGGPASGDSSDAPDTTVADVEAPDATALALVVPPVLPGQSLVPSSPDSSTTAPGHANVADEVGATPSGPGSDIRMSGDAAPAPGHRTGVSQAGDAPTTKTTPTGPDATPAMPTAAGPADQGTGSPDGAPTATAPLTVQPAPNVAPTALAPGTAEPTPTHHVTRQVFPEVTGMVTRGDGTHRITLTLKPEALGEVRVVMTVRDGAVHVRLAAGHEAQQALRDGSSELSRLLEAAGAHESRVVVRDLPAASPTATTSGSPDLGTDGQRHQDQHAGTRAHHPATDGTHDGTRHRRGASGAEPRSNEPVTRTRTAGVDVTM